MPLASSLSIWPWLHIQTDSQQSFWSLLPRVFFLFFFQLKGLTRSSWGWISWWRSSLQSTDESESTVWPIRELNGAWWCSAHLFFFFVQCVLIKCFQSKPVDVARLLLSVGSGFPAPVSPSPCWLGGARTGRCLIVHGCLHMHTVQLQTAEEREGGWGGEAVGGVTTMVWGLRLFVHKMVYA